LVRSGWKKNMSIEETMGPLVGDVSDPDPPRTMSARLSPRYWKLWAATAVSSLGDGVVAIALPLLAVSVTRDGLALGGLLAALRLPWLLVAVPLGAVADRVDRRRMAVGIETLRTVVLAVLAVAIGEGLRSLPFLYLVAFSLGTLEAGFVAATSAAVPDLVGKEGLAHANGHLAAANTAGEDFLGVGLGGLAFVALAALPFVLDSVTFAISAVLLLSALPRAAQTFQIAETAGPLPAHQVRRPADRGTGVDGLRYVLSDRALRVLLLANAGLAFLQAMMMGVLVAFALVVLHVTGSGYGLMLSMAALGMIAGGVLAGRLVRRLGNPAVLLLGACGAAIAYLALAYAAAEPTAVAALALEGFSVIVGRTAITTMRHERVPNALQGRTNTIFRSVVYGVVPLGAVAGGVISELWSLHGAIAAAGLLQVAAVAFLARPVLRRLTDETIDLC